MPLPYMVQFLVERQSSRILHMTAVRDIGEGTDALAGVVIVGVSIWWHASAKKWFTGPISNLGEEEAAPPATGAIEEPEPA